MGSGEGGGAVAIHKEKADGQIVQGFASSPTI